MTNEEAIKILSYNTNLGYGIIIEAMEGYTTRDIKIALDMAIKALKERPQGEWFDYIEKNKIVKARHGNYVIYKVDFLLDNLTKEVYIMEGARRMRGEEK